MKKEDLTTRLLRNLFHIQGPFDECRQEIIYKACARSMVQIIYSSFFLFLFYLLFGRFIETVRYAMPYLYFGLIFILSSRVRLQFETYIWIRTTRPRFITKATAKVKSKFVVGVYSSAFSSVSSSY